MDNGDNENDRLEMGYGSVDVDKHHPRFRTFIKDKGIGDRDRDRKNRTHIPKKSKKF